MKNEKGYMAVEIFAVMFLILLLTGLVFLVISATGYVDIKTNGECKAMEDWSLGDLPARCFKELKVEK